MVTASSVPEASTLPLDAPVFIMLHGINGGSHEGPTKWALATAAARGWRCVALNLRGCGGAALASPKVYCAASSSDVRAAVDACHALYPAARILLSAYSLGTYIVGTYLAEEDCKPGGAARRGVAGAVLTSCPMEPHSSYAGLSDPDVPSGLMYNGAIAAKLREYFYKHSEAIHEHPEVDAKALNIAAMRTVADFERAVIVTTHGFKDVDEYYEYFSPARIVPAIRTPTLYVVARDDPFLGQTAGIERAVRESKHVALAHVARGGHVAFLEKGVGVFGQCWTDRVTGEFLQAALDPRSDAAEAAAKSAGAPTTVIARNIPDIGQKRIVARTSIVDVVDEDDDRSTRGDAAARSYRASRSLPRPRRRASSAPSRASRPRGASPNPSYDASPSSLAHARRRSRRADSRARAQAGRRVRSRTAGRGATRRTSRRWWCSGFILSSPSRRSLVWSTTPASAPIWASRRRRQRWARR